jgi:hypothetical protein
MSDMMSTVIPKSDQLNADDLIGGKTLTITITAAHVAAGTEQPCTLNYQGDNGKPYKPCKSMRRVLIEIWGKDSKQYVGKSMTLYCDQKVKFGGVEVGGIRISHMSHMSAPRTLALTATKANKKPFVVKPLEGNTAPPAQQQTPTRATIDPAVKKAGDEAAAKGVDAYVAWRDALPADVKETIRPFNSEWSKIAKAFVPPPAADDIPFDDGSAQTQGDDDEPAI